jgi:murein L,D-transpeptidase YcbB/YkuD
MDRTIRRALMAVAAVSVVAAAGWAWVRYTDRRVNTDYQLDLVVAGKPRLRVSATLRSDVRAFYERRNLAPVWISETSVEPRALAALDVLDRAAAHGLEPADYDAGDLRGEFDTLAHPDAENTASPDRLAHLMSFDVRLTSALLSLGHDVAVGRTSPAALDARFQSQRTPPDLARTLAAAINADLSQWLGAIQPRHAEYTALMAVLADPERLAAPGIDNVADIVAANMERWRWMPDDFGARYLYVNIPSYQLLARDAGKTSLTMRVVVGKPATNETPIISSEISTLVFRPTWNIPASIVARETIPAVLRDPTYLRRQNIEAFRVTAAGTTLIDTSMLKPNAAELKQLVYRQKSGDWNALGRVKFVFQNAFDVYLHDTPADGAFSRAMRALSHGCVRLEQPEVLAEYVLNGSGGWTGARIKHAMAAGKEQYVKLPAPLPVHLVYFTATVDAAGVLRILPDIYGIDAKQLRRPLADYFIGRSLNFSL